MRALLFLVGALALAAYVFTADPFGEPEPERCPGGVCPTPEHTATPVQSQVIKAASASFVSSTPPIVSEPILRAEPRHEKRVLPRGKDGWRIRLFYPRSAERIANQILDDINGFEPLSNFCNTFGFGSLRTDDIRFDEWQSLGYQADVVSLVLVAPDSRSIYYVHNVPRSPRTLLASLQEKMDGYYSRSEWQPTRNFSQQPITGRMRRW